VPHGESKAFYENGKLQSVANYKYKGGKFYGEFKSFDEKGNLIKAQN